MTPAEIHELGLSEVKRDEAEMQQVAASSGFKGDFDAFENFLRTDPQFYYTDPEALLSGYRDIAKQIDPILPNSSDKLPRLTYGIRAIPAYAADSAPAAYYMSGSVAAGRPGWFCANTSQPDEPSQVADGSTHPARVRARASSPVIAGRRKWRTSRSSASTAVIRRFAEGWALYCERLGSELGFYKDPYSKFGQLTFDMWRACRLVIDTGIHTQGWSRQQAIDYLMANAGKG